jgi:YD repeat-containing protein
MKHGKWIAVNIWVAAVCGACAAELTEVINLGNGGAYVTTRRTQVAREHSEFNYSVEDGWAYLMPMIADSESTFDVTVTTGTVDTVAYTERRGICSSSSPCVATYKRYLNSIAIILPPTNDYVNGTLEWSVRFRSCGQNGINDTPVDLGVNRANVAAGGSVVIRQVLWPDWTPREVGGGSLERCRFEVTSPTLFVTKRTAAEGRPDRSTTSDPLAIVGDPIDGINGNVSLAETDLSVPAAGLPLEFRRVYGTVLDGDASLGGVRWSHTYFWKIGESNTVYGGATNRWLVLRAGDDWHWKALDVANGSHEIDDGWRWTWTYSNGCYEVVRPGGLHYAFNSNGMLAAIRTAASNSLTLVYTNLAPGVCLSQVQHSDGRALTFTYNATGLLAQVNCAFTNVGMRYEYTAAGLLAQADRACGGMTQSTWYAWSEASQVLTQRMDAAGVQRVWEYQGGKGTRSYVGTNRWYETALEYGSNGLNRTHITISRGDTNIVFYQEWDPVRQKVVRTSTRMWPQMIRLLVESPVFTNTFLYQNGDTFGVLGLNSYYQSEVQTQLGHDGNPTAGWAGTEYTRDDYGRIVTAEERAGALDGQSYSTALLAYDSVGRLTNWAYGFQSAATTAWSWGWNTNVDLLSFITDPEGRRTEWDYTNGMVSVERVFPATNQPSETAFSYTTNGLLTAITNANGHWVRFQHDAYGYPAIVSVQAGPTNWMSWDSLGHLKEIRLPSTEYTTNEPPEMVPRVIAFDPDELGRVRQITWPDDSVERFSFDAIGNVTNHVDAAGRTTRFSWLPTRKLASVTRYLTGASNQAAAVGMEYDQQMNVLKIKDELERGVETYQLDLQDRPVKVTNLESQEMTVTYGLGDMVSQLVRFDGSSVSFSGPSGNSV